MNQKHELELLGTKQRLREWAYWCNDILTMGLGFPKKSIIGRLIDTKGEIIRSTTPALSPENQLAEEVDRLINEYSKTHFNRAKVLVLHYLNKDKKITERIASSGFAKSTYFYNLDEAEQWIHKQL
ncbi:MAG: hypothetical protein K2Q14_04800 [Gammaproteobacteria bacterium]|nr:hypothetical protein [Gammaproteobacteria bacterium]MBY0544851.1 hypothetical protein [Gammaproteobacteria bacterium]